MELQRRAHVFCVLAACYETLVYYREEYNACLHNTTTYLTITNHLHHSREEYLWVERDLQCLDRRRRAMNNHDRGVVETMLLYLVKKKKMHAS